jgi:hypothetical protein
LILTQLLLERMQQSDGLVLHVIAPFTKEIDWDDLESIRNHRTTTAYERTKTCNRAIAAELARRYAGKISSVAFNPTFIIDKSDPELDKRWPSGLMGFFCNGALFKLDKRVEKPDKAMNDEVLGKRLWDELVRLTGLTPE